jgi:hypothetical protein
MADGCGSNGLTVIQEQVQPGARRQGKHVYSDAGQCGGNRVSLAQVLSNQGPQEGGVCRCVQRHQHRRRQG